MTSNRGCPCRAGPGGPKQRRPIRAAWRPAPVLLGDWVQSRYMTGDLSLAEAREILPDFYPEVMSFDQFDEFMATDKAAGNPSDDEEFR